MRVESVNVARATPLQVEGRVVLSAIGKQAVAGPVEVNRLGLAGDEQADLSVHGGLDKAVYAYPTAHYPFWQTVRAQARVADFGETLRFGALGENLSIEGLLESELWIGDRLELPDCTLAVSAPRIPCFKFAAAMGFAHAPRLMAQSGYCGAYLAVIQPGLVRAGDPIECRPGPREVNLRELFGARMRSR